MTSLFLSMLLIGAAATADVEEMYDCTPMVITYPFMMGKLMVMSSDPPVKKCPALCFPETSSSTLSDVEVEVEEGETKTIRHYLSSDTACVFSPVAHWDPMF